jgi:glucose-6-phosphate 1-dehydrogenase
VKGTETAGAVVIFGATGDLSERMLLPSLFGLAIDGLLPDDLKIIGAARTDLDDQGFQTFAAQAIAHLGDSASRAAFLSRVGYQKTDASSASDMKTLGKRVRVLRGDRSSVFHLSVAPKLYAQLARGLKDADLNCERCRLMLEKPIGVDGVSARETNEAVADAFPENRVLRVDHYLGKEGVQNLLALRFGNALFEPLWSSRQIEHIQITVGETVGVEDRFDYYDGSGALRDMVQNHILQLLALVAMEPPYAFTPDAVRDEKVKVLNALRPITSADVQALTVTGQYTAGAVQGALAPGYLEEGGSASSGTETFVAIKAHIDNWRWAGVPFYIRTGKRMPKRHTEIFIQFKPIPHTIFPREDTVAGGMLAHPNALSIELQPEEAMQLWVANKIPGLDREGMRLSRAPLKLDLNDAFPQARRRIAYERLYLDAIENQATLFVRSDEIDAAWAWIDGIRDAWREVGLSPKPYVAGSWGPSMAMSLPERFGHTWFDP